MTDTSDNSASDLRHIDDFLALNRKLDGIIDLDVLLEKILEIACDWVRADGGSIYLLEDGHLRIGYTRCLTLQRRLGPGRKLVFASVRFPISPGTISGYVATTGKAVTIDDVYELGEDEPYQHGRDFDEKANYRTRSMMAVPLTSQRGDVVGVLQIINRQPETPEEPFGEVEMQAITHFASRAATAIEQARLTRELVLRMISMAELRDPVETGMHANRVAGYSVELYEAWARHHGLAKDTTDQQRSLLRTAAMLHDVGKVAIPDAILHKPDKLTNDEFDTMKSHTVIGARLLEKGTTEMEAMAREIALDHHSNWDGTGYPLHDMGEGEPRPKRGDEIPLMAQIVAMADVYDALSTPRSYKRAWTEEEITEEIRQLSGRKYQPELVELFFEVHEHLLAIKARYPEPEAHPGVT